MAVALEIAQSSIAEHRTIFPLPMAKTSSILAADGDPGDAAQDLRKELEVTLPYCARDAAGAV
jgi:hypothetical protein